MNILRNKFAPVAALVLGAVTFFMPFNEASAETTPVVAKTEQKAESVLFQAGRYSKADPANPKIGIALCVPHGSSNDIKALKKFLLSGLKHIDRPGNVFAEKVEKGGTTIKVYVNGIGGKGQPPTKEGIISALKDAKDRYDLEIRRISNQENIPIASNK